MQLEGIPFRKTGYFSDLINDYLDESDSLKPFYARFPNIESFKSQLEEKKQSFTEKQRTVLVKALRKQYGEISATTRTKEHIKLLSENNTFTIVTGHQLNLFTGPLYFLYKIISTINLCTTLKKQYPDYHFVPVYWMATEDHDFEEINYFNFKGKKLQWNRESEGAVGSLSTKGLDGVLEMFTLEMGAGKFAAELKRLFKEAYLKHEDLASATRYLANELFGKEGLVIVDGDDALLKQSLVPYIRQDLFQNIAFKEVSKTINKLESVAEGYNIQVNPREINYFYLKEGLRERILEKDGMFYVNNTALEFTKEEIAKEIEQYPERFSPNVIARPLYQEVILPNLCYIGGGGELAYWLELKSFFDAVEVPFPILLLRNSALAITEKQQLKLQKMNLKVADLFLDQNRLINKKIREISNIDIDFSPQRNHLKEQFKELYKLAEKTDKSFLGAVKAQEVKQLKGLDKLEKRLLKAQKRKLKDQVVRMTEIQNELFPNQSLQERSLNFSELYLDIGEDLIPKLIKSLDPLAKEFYVLRFP
ncbi:bacillithiol biosynthesis cysteine-adding enzyme BshC [Muriicola sp. E247]|uniref:bacillithiol biosynthesis cysteine-adding enzyme BshC n=1 Tax=Muriicola sp. E247 TaxID=3242730 RepID=UPI0035266A92